LPRSPGHDRIFGYQIPLPEWTQSTFLQHVHADDRPAVEDALAEAIAHGQSVDFDVRVTCADGELKWIWLHGKVLRDTQGKALSVLGSLHDITTRKLAEERLKIQLERLNLLDTITPRNWRAPGPAKHFQVVIRSLEDNLPIDFGCICLSDPASASLRVICVGVRGEELAGEMAMTEHSVFPIDTNGLTRCVQGQLVYEPDVAALDSPFPRRIARGGLRSLVAAPLLVANEIFGVVIAARKQANGFASNDCEFLRQLKRTCRLGRAPGSHPRSATKRLRRLTQEPTDGNAAGTLARLGTDGERHCP